MNFFCFLFFCKFEAAPPRGLSWARPQGVAREPRTPEGRGGSGVGEAPRPPRRPSFGPGRAHAPRFLLTARQAAAPRAGHLGAARAAVPGAIRARSGSRAASPRGAHARPPPQ